LQSGLPSSAARFVLVDANCIPDSQISILATIGTQQKIRLLDAGLRRHDE
jgi:hypothetical protein